MPPLLKGYVRALLILETAGERQFPSEVECRLLACEALASTACEISPTERRAIGRLLTRLVLDRLLGI